MTRQPRAFFALDHGSASTSAALVAYVGDRWRLVAHAAAPAFANPEALLLGMTEGVARVDPELLRVAQGSDSADARAAAAELPRIEARSGPRAKLAVVAATEKHRSVVEGVAARSGWEVSSGSAEVNDPLQLSRLMLAPETTAILVSAADPPSSEERRLLRQVGAVAAAARSRRPGIAIVLAGGAAQRMDLFGAGGHTAHGAHRGHAGHSGGMPDAGDRRAGVPHDAAGAAESGVILGPEATAGHPAGAALQEILETLRSPTGDARLGIVRTLRSLAYVLDRAVEVVEVGLDGGLRARAEPLPGAGHRDVASTHAIFSDAGFAPPEPSDAILDTVGSWSGVAFDRYRLPDRLRDLRLAPWGDAGTDGAALRLAGARAALDRLVSRTPEMSARPAPDVLIAAGGVWQSVPPPVLSLALVDLVRRPGVSQLAFDAATLLGPLGMIESEDERRQILRDLADDLLLPLGSAIVPSGLREGRSAGRLRLRSASASDEIDLEPGTIRVADLAPGATAVADLDFRETVHLGVRGRHFATRVSGGLTGLVVDLRDVPLVLPDRAEERRRLLELWQETVWPEVEA